MEILFVTLGLVLVALAITNVANALHKISASLQASSSTPTDENSNEETKETP